MLNFVDIPGNVKYAFTQINVVSAGRLYGIIITKGKKKRGG
jgi:hypothetical protein